MTMRDTRRGRGLTAGLTVVGWDGAPPRPEARRALERATLVVGGRRHLDACTVPGAARSIVMGDVTAAVDEVFAHLDGGAGPVVVLASGDPGLFGVLRALRARGLRPAAVPAVSSVAEAFARCGLPWDDALVVSVHGRALRPAVNACRAHPKVAVLTGPGAGPAALGEALGGTGRVLVVAEDLGAGPERERVTRCSPGEAARCRWRDPNVVLVLDEARAVGERGWLHGGGVGGARRWAVPENAYRHRDGMVTKAEVRAVALARLAPGVGDLVWDVGAGSGSVGIECAALGAAVVAVDRDPHACALVAENAQRHGRDVEVAQGSAPGVLAGLPDPDAVFVGGGGPETVDACARRRPARVVVALAAVERVGPAWAALADAGYAVDGVQLQANRLAGLPDGTHRLAATNPVLLLSGELA